MSWLMENWGTILMVSLTVIGSASVAVKAIAPFTETTLDDKLAGALSWLHGVLSKLALK